MELARALVVAKLDGLNITEQSITTVSGWCIFHRKVRFARFSCRPACLWTMNRSTVQCARRCGMTAIMNVQEARKIVSTWEAEFSAAADMQKRLAMLYLANDILQRSRKKGPEYVNEFFRVLPRAIQSVMRRADGKVSKPWCDARTAGRASTGR